MHDEHTDNAPSRRRRGLFALAHRSAASWSERAPSGATSALAPAPGVAGVLQRQGAPEQKEVGTSKDSTAEEAPPTPAPSADQPSPTEQPVWRELDAPPLPLAMNRRRTKEKRTVEKKVRFTPSAAEAITAAAAACGKRFAGFVGDAALSAALGHTGGQSGPEDDPHRQLLHAIETHTQALDRIGRNLNQITAAINRGEIPARTEHVLAAVEQAVRYDYTVAGHVLGA
ncbi:plasmid mobilization protein [Streptomyces sp. NPDC091272]|uniref:plasmid mobilization protein n=1 Tax=Streptomyces sp. NPDC091272 TaxID=3365981 RepID=UPI003812B51A